MVSSAQRAVLAVATRQHGVVSRDQFLEAGGAASTWRRQRASGLLVAIGPTTSLVAGLPLTDWALVLAACLEVDGVASHRTAAWMSDRFPRPDVIDVMTSRVRPTQRAPLLVGGWEVCVHSTTSLPPEDLIELHGIPCTGIARTMLGLAALVPHGLSQEVLVEVIATTIDRQQATMAWLWWLLEHRRCRGRNGVTNLEAALVELDDLGPTESWLERESLRLFAQRSIPRPRTQHIVRRSGRFAARVDFLWEAERLVVEVLGHEHHRTARQMADDARRLNEVQLAGYRVLQYTYDDIVRAPDRVGPQILATLALGPPDWLPSSA